MSAIAGTLLVWIPLSLELARIGAFSGMGSSWRMNAFILLCYASTAGLGFIGGAMFIGWYARRCCRRWNGAPHETGERVVVLSGAHAGRAGIIQEIGCGQGGLPVLLVDQGTGAGEAFSGLFSEYELLRLSPRASA